MKKYGRLFIWIGLAVCAAALVTLYFLEIRVPAPDEIYRSSLSGIVEVKCETEEGGTSFGTAELLDRRGTLVTNAHVVTYSRLGQIEVFSRCFIRFAHEEDYRSAEILCYDGALDIALLKLAQLPDRTLKPLKTADSAALKAGDRIYAMGNSQNHGISMSEGVVGIPSLNLEYRGSTRNVIQCDITITEGNSGGALLDQYGRLVGITTFRLKDSSGNVIYGIAYCLPIQTVLEYMNQNQ